MPRRPEPDALARIPTVFEAGAHKISVAMDRDWVWTCSVDGAPLGQRYMTQVEAWEAGVRESERLNRAAPHA
jgi:hypothetical protein